MNKLSISKIRIFSNSIFVIYILAFYVFVLITIYTQSNSQPLVSDVFTLIGEILAILILLYGIQRQGKNQRMEWIYFAIGIACNLAGDITWSLFEVVWNVEIPVPSVCDLFYLPGSFLFIVAIYMYIRKGKIFSIVKTGFDITIAMVASTTLILNYLLVPVWTDTGLSFWGRVVLLSYPILDLGYIAGLLSIVFNHAVQTKRNRTNLYLILGFGCLFVVDMVFAILDENDPLGNFFDPLWTIGFLSIAIASLFTNYDILDTNHLNSEEKRKRIDELLDYGRFLLPYILTGLIIVIVSYNYIMKDPLVTGSVITVMLIMLRQIFTLLENKKLLSMLQKSNQLLEENKANLEVKNQKLKKIKEVKEKEARTDYLTNLFNRRHIHDWLDKYIKDFSEDEIIELSVLLIDIDYFKQINDTWGHAVGDTVLKQFAQIIKTDVRTEDIAGRYGGDEFIVILPNTSEEIAQSIAERLLQAVHTKIFAENPELNVTLSIGNFHWEGKAADYSLDRIVAEADKALYEAKFGGRDRVFSRNTLHGDVSI